MTNPDGIGTPPAGLAALRSSFTYAQFDNLVINSSQPFAFPHALFDKHLLVPPRPSPRVDQDPAVPRSDFNGLVGCRFRVGTTPLVADALARFAGLSNGSHELSILDGTTFLVVPLSISQEVAISRVRLEYATTLSPRSLSPRARSTCS